MPLWISLYLPTHSLDIGFPNWSADTMAAVLDKGRVLLCTPAAAAKGVRPGTSADTARGLASDIQLACDAPDARLRHLHDTALSLLQYTPNVSFFENQAILLEVSASLSLFRGPRTLCHRIRATLRNQGAHARLGMAPSAVGAWVLSRQPSGRRRMLDTHLLAQRLDVLPPQVLPAAQPYSDWLEGIGCRTLKQLRALPRKALQQRSSPLLLQQVDAAYGQAPEVFSWFEAPPTFSQVCELTERIEHCNGIQIVVMRLIEQLSGWLQARQLSTRSLNICLHHEKGRHARPPSQVALHVSESAWQPSDFLPVLRERLQALTLPAPVISIRLSVTQTATRPTHSGTLFPEPAQWLHQERRLLDLLRARLGDQHVLDSQPVADYRPEQANLWRPMHDNQNDSAASLSKGSSSPRSGPVTKPHTAVAPTTGTAKSRTAKATMPSHLGMHNRPFWLLDPPQSLTVVANRPVYNGISLHLIHGPERLESGWWSPSGHERRDYFIARDAKGVRYWLYRQRESQGAGWFLQGLFG